jgi:transposase
MSLEHNVEPAAILTHLGAIFVSLELSQSKWLITSVSPGAGEKMSKHAVEAGDVAGLRARFAELRRRALARTGRGYPIIVIQEAGLDGFWIHRILEREGIESHVVDAASIPVPRRRRRAKTDKIDGETLLRLLMAFKRGDPRVCSMARAPAPADEDRRHVCRERKELIVERVEHVNRIKGLLLSQGIRDYQPLHRDRRRALELLHTGDGRALEPRLKTRIGRELGRLELLIAQIEAVERERDMMLKAEIAVPPPLHAPAPVRTETEAEAETPSAPSSPISPTPPSPATMLTKLKGIGPEFAAVLLTEAFYRSFANRRQVAAFGGLAPTPWQSGSIDHEQGVSQAGNPRLRTTMIQLAWLWLRHQPDSELSKWFRARGNTGPGARQRSIVALARKLLVALWKYVTSGVVIEGAVMKTGAAA